MQIILRYFKRKNRNRRITGDPIYSNLYYEENMIKIAESIVDSSFLDTEYLKSELGNISGLLDQTSFVNLLSLNLSYRQ